MDNNHPASGSVTTGDQRPSVVAHTPGPWKVFWGKRKRHMFIGIGTETGDGITDSHFGIWRGDSAEAAANARLIAAAPDMLEALCTVAAQFDAIDNIADADACARVFAAIRKATSEAPDRSEPTQSQEAR